MDRSSPLARAVTDLERRLARRDQGVLTDVVHSHGDQLIRHLALVFRHRLDKDERMACLHDALITVFDGNLRYDPTRASAETFLKRQVEYAAKKYLDKRRKIRAEMAADSAAMESCHAADPDPAEVVADAEATALAVAEVRKAIGRVSERSAVALLAWLNHGPSGYREHVSNAIGVRAETVGQWFVRGKTEIMAILGDRFDLLD